MNISRLLDAGIRVATIIIAIEFLLSLMLLAIAPDMSASEIVIINGVALAVLSIPLVSIYVIKPVLDDKAKALAELRDVATSDPLTQLANRRLVMEHLNRVVAGCTRHHEYCAVLVINLDNFKLINERYGYEKGDAVLLEVARRLRATNRSSDVVGRIGGDEFAVLLERQQTDIDITGQRIRKMADKFVAMINMPIKVDTNSIHVSASVGIRLLGFEPIDTDTAIRDADSAMYRAKEAGGNRVVIFTRENVSKSRPSNNEYLDQQMTM